MKLSPSMPIWIVRPYKSGGEAEPKLDYEKEVIYFSYEAAHESVLHTAFELECHGASPIWCEMWEYENEPDGTMQANWIYRPVSGTEMIRWPFVVQG